MTKHFAVPFASSGDKTAVLDSLQGGGTVSYTEGWGADYELDQLSDPSAKDVDRQAENQLKFDITEAIKEIQEFGLLVYRADVDYPLDAKVTGSDGLTYRCFIVNGPASTPVDPVGDVTGAWDSKDSIIHVQHRTTSGVGGGISSSGSWLTAPLNTVVSNNLTGSSLSTNQITLDIGTYEVDFYSCGQDDALFQSRLYNVTDVTDVAGFYSTVDDTGPASPGAHVHAKDLLVVSGSAKTYRIEQRFDTGSAQGFGQTTGYSQINIYRDILIKKVA